MTAGSKLPVMLNEEEDASVNCTVTYFGKVSLLEKLKSLPVGSVPVPIKQILHVEEEEGTSGMLKGEGGFISSRSLSGGAAGSEKLTMGDKAMTEDCPTKVLEVKEAERW